MFKLLAIKTYFSDPNLNIENNSAWLRRLRILKPGVLYRFYDGYEIKEDKITKKENCLPDNFFRYKDSRLNISISALVGKNGMGKSSLVDLYLRIMNNVAYCLYQNLEIENTRGNSKLVFVRYIYARIYFEVNDRFCYFEQKDENITFKYLDNEEDSWQCNKYNAKDIGEKEALRRMSRMPFSEIVNYSSYAYNFNDYMQESNDYTNIYSQKEEDCWLEPLFHKTDSYQLPIILNPLRDKGNIDYNNEMVLTKDRLFLLTGLEENPLREILVNKKITAYVFDVNDQLTPQDGKFCSIKVFNECLQSKLLTQKEYSPAFKKGISKIINSVAKDIIDMWSKCFGYDIFKIIKEYKEDSKDLQNCLNYIVYKVIKIANNYPDFGIKPTELRDKDKLEEFIKKLFLNDSPITSKLFRCFAFILFHFYGSRDFNGGEDFPITQYWEKARKILHKEITLQSIFEGKGYEKENSFVDLNLHNWNISDLLPTPSFSYDFLIEENNEQNDKNKLKKSLIYIPFSALSSGEKQMVFLFTTVVYHLHNLDVICENKNRMNEEMDGNLIGYQNIQIIFDEIELYFHPEYQMKLVNLLLRYLSNLRLKSIQNINILIATHSPFVLSDIPKNNILGLNDGKPKPIKVNPFGANIFEILHSSFFLDNFIGDFSSSKIQKLVKKLESRIKPFSEDEASSIRNEVNMIGDEMIRRILFSSLNELTVIR